MQEQEKYLISIEKAKKSLKIADHLTYMTFPVVRENRLLLKILEEISNSIISTINSILQYEYLYKRIKLYSNAKDNFEIFKKLTPKYSINQEQLNKIIEILSLAEQHKSSSFEFVKNDKVVIMTNNLNHKTLTIDKTKEYITETKNFLNKVLIMLYKH